MTPPGGWPLVSVLTPTWQRHEFLTTRCLPSVEAQDYPGEVEHIVVCDGPDPDLAGVLMRAVGWTAVPFLDEYVGDDDGGELRMAAPTMTRRRAPVHLAFLPEHDVVRHWGSPARKHAATLARGEFITYCDDDDALRPEHVGALAMALLDNPDWQFVLSRMVSHQPGGTAVIGHGQLGFGNVGTPMIMHRRGLLTVADWDVSAAGEDWEIVAKWLGAAVPYGRVDAETVDVWPSTFRGY